MLEERAGFVFIVNLRIRCPGATRSRGTEVHDILGRTSVFSHRSSQPSAEGTGKMLYLPKRNMTSFSNYELLMSPTVSSTRALAKQGEHMQHRRSLEQPGHHTGTLQTDRVRTEDVFPTMCPTVHMALGRSIYRGDKYHPTPLASPHCSVARDHITHYTYINF